MLIEERWWQGLKHHRLQHFFFLRIAAVTLCHHDTTSASLITLLKHSNVSFSKALAVPVAGHQPKMRAIKKIWVKNLKSNILILLVFFFFFFFLQIAQSLTYGLQKFTFFYFLYFIYLFLQLIWLLLRALTSYMHYLQQYNEHYLHNYITQIPLIYPHRLHKHLPYFLILVTMKVLVVQTFT